MESFYFGFLGELDLAVVFELFGFGVWERGGGRGSGGRETGKYDGREVVGTELRFEEEEESFETFRGG